MAEDGPAGEVAGDDAVPDDRDTVPDGDLEPSGCPVEPQPVRPAVTAAARTDRRLHGLTPPFCGGTTAARSTTRH